MYRFRPVRRADLPLLRGWLRTPEVARWWGEPDKEAAILEEGLDDPRIAMRIVALRGHPFAYIQDYDIHAWPQHPFAHLPPGTRGLDTFIGDPDLIGQGHGSAYLRQRARALLSAGAPALAIDPDPLNVRARRAYENAGFEGSMPMETDFGPIVLMTFSG